MTFGKTVRRCAICGTVIKGPCVEASTGECDGSAFARTERMWLAHRKCFVDALPSRESIMQELRRPIEDYERK